VALALPALAARRSSDLRCGPVPPPPPPQTVRLPKWPHLGMVRALLVLGLIGVSCGQTRGEEPSDRPAPFLVRNLNPFIQVYGLPPFQAVEVTPPRHAQVQLTLDVANNAKLADGVDESITLDGETYRLALLVRLGLWDWLEAGVEIPFVFHRHGVLDDVIDGWHGLWGMPEGDRPKMPNDALDYSYRFQGQELVAIRSDQQGLGDVRLFSAATLFRADDGGRELSLHGSLKLPTGDSARLLGSGGTDLAVSVNGVERSLSSSGITGFGRLGLLALGAGDVLATRQRQAVVFGGLGLAWRAGSRVDLKAQLDGYGPFYQSELPQLGSSSVQLTVGGTIHLGPSTTLDLAVGENLFTDSIPDVVFHVTVSHRE
jgi:hypothetical protein